MPPVLPVESWGLVDYSSVWNAMRAWIDARLPDSDDVLWQVEHTPVYTLGQAGRREHILDAGDIPVIQTDRGGQVTYHGPGQAVLYPLLNLRRYGLGPRRLVSVLEQTVVDWLSDYNVTAVPRADAPGVYVDDAKVAAVGLRIRRGFSYHGLAVNIDMDLDPFLRINPCGYAGMAVVDAASLGVNRSLGQAFTELTHHLQRQLASC